MKTNAELERLMTELADAVFYRDHEKIDRDRKAIASLFDAVAKMDWQPIQTAPKDGSQFLLLKSREAKIWISCWYSQAQQGFYETMRGYPMQLTGIELWHPSPELPVSADAESAPITTN